MGLGLADPINSGQSRLDAGAADNMFHFGQAFATIGLLAQGCQDGQQISITGLRRTGQLTFSDTVTIADEHNSLSALCYAKIYNANNLQ